LIGNIDECRSVGHRNDGDSRRQSSKGLADGFLGFRIERTGGLVQDKQSRAVGERTGDGDPLSLASRELAAPLADDASTLSPGF